MSLAFVKMHGAGNDFVLIDSRSENSAELDASLAQRLADRRIGVGADQILWLERGRDLPFAYRIFNADGSTAGQCGNGARCIAAYLHRHYGLPKRFSIESPAGLVHARILDADSVEVSLGEPSMQASHVPTTLVAESDGLVRFEALGKQWQGTALSLGNPHLVIEVDDVSSAPLAELGAWVQQSASFPDGANLGLVEVQSADLLRLRVFERGVGETLACGSGACAAAIAMCLRGRSQSPVELSLPGGLLKVRWGGVGDSVYLAGPAEFVYVGVMES